MGFESSEIAKLAKLWLCQDSYIDKVAARFGIDLSTRVSPHTPLPTDIPLAFDGESTAADRYGYQSRIGSINFAATVTRPDIAKACSLLSQFLQNPGPEHLRAADRVIAYLASTKFVSIEYCGLLDYREDKQHPGLWIESFPWESFSDAAYADNADRKSSDGYLFLLYGGPIDWKASKQATVTTSTTEAELLALSRCAKEVMAWGRFFNEISFTLDRGLKLIQSDNRQTIRLLKTGNTSVDHQTPSHRYSSTLAATGGPSRSYRYRLDPHSADEGRRPDQTSVTTAPWQIHSTAQPRRYTGHRQVVDALEGCVEPPRYFWNAHVAVAVLPMRYDAKPDLDVYQRNRLGDIDAIRAFCGLARSTRRQEDWPWNAYRSPWTASIVQGNRIHRQLSLLIH